MKDIEKISRPRLHLNVEETLDKLDEIIDKVNDLRSRVAILEVVSDAFDSRLIRLEGKKSE